MLADLGRGAATDVYKVTDECRAWAPEADRLVALKILKDPTDLRPEAREALRREFDRLRRLTHPNIVKVYDFDQDKTTACYTMELLEGERLSDLIGRTAKKRLPRAYAFAIVRAVGAALAHAHARGTTHGDVCARNVLIGLGGELRLLGFGGADAARSSAAQYASCEILQGMPAEPRDDVFALACLACELIGGANPFEGVPATEMRARGLRPSRPEGLDFSTWRTLGAASPGRARSGPSPFAHGSPRSAWNPNPPYCPPSKNPQRNFAMRVQHVAFVAALVASAALAYFFVWHSIDPVSDRSVPAVADGASVPPAASPAPDTKSNPPTPPLRRLRPLARTPRRRPPRRLPSRRPRPHRSSRPSNSRPSASPFPRARASQRSTFSLAPELPSSTTSCGGPRIPRAHSGVDFVAQDRPPIRSGTARERRRST